MAAVGLGTCVAIAMGGVESKHREKILSAGGIEIILTVLACFVLGYLSKAGERLYGWHPSTLTQLRNGSAALLWIGFGGAVLQLVLRCLIPEPSQQRLH